MIELIAIEPPDLGDAAVRRRSPRDRPGVGRCPLRSRDRDWGSRRYHPNRAERRGVSRQLLGQEIITLVGLQIRDRFTPFQCRVRQAGVRDRQFLGDHLDELTQQLVAFSMLSPQRHDLQILPVVIDLDIAPLRDRVHQLLIEGPIHAAEDHPPVGNLGQPVELVEGRDVRDGPRISSGVGAAMVVWVVAVVMVNLLMRITDCGYGLRITDYRFGLRITDYRLQITDCGYLRLRERRSSSRSHPPWSSADSNTLLAVSPFVPSLSSVCSAIERPGDPSP